MSADDETPAEHPGPWSRPVPPSPRQSRWEEVGVSWVGVLQALKAAAILGLIVAILRLLSH